MVRCLLYLLIGVVLTFTNVSVQAQSTHNHAMCGVGFDEGQAIKDRMLNNRRNKEALLATFEIARSNDSTVFVPLQFHIVTKNDGTGGETIKEVLANLCKLNEDYAFVNVEFYLAGPIRFINQQLLYDNDFGPMGSYFMGMYKVPGVVNIFIGNSIDNGGSAGTTLGYYTSALDVIYAIRSSVYSQGTTLTHELGHLFSLPHTFFGWENLRYSNNTPTVGVPNVMEGTNGRTPTITTNGVTVELIPRSGGTENCQIAADGFCDTDPDYQFGFYGTDYNTINGAICTFAATAHDPQGWLFRPEMIAPKARLVLKENETNVHELYIKNTSTKDIIHPLTLMVVETEYTFGGNTYTTWHDTLGNSDSTDIYCNKNNAEDNIVGTGIRDVKKGFIHMDGVYFKTEITCPTEPGLSFARSPAIYTAFPTGNHRITIGNLTVTNNGTDTVWMLGTNLDITDMFYDTTMLKSSSTRTIPLSDTIAPGQSLVMNAGLTDLLTSTHIANVQLNANTYAPYRDTTGTSSENVMSYYPDQCATEFSVEQGEAMKMDIASRGFATLYDKPTDTIITDTVTIIYPSMNSIAPQPTFEFKWYAVTGATMYHVYIFEINFLNMELANGKKYDLMTADTSFWLTLESGKRFGWRVYPLNAVSFCDLNSVGSTQANFQVFNWAVGVEQIQAEIADSKLYPNPSGLSQDVMLEINSTIMGDAQINIYNSIGQEVMPTQSITLVKGTNLEQINTSSLAAGLYIVNIKTKNGTVSHKLAIQG